MKSETNSVICSNPLSIENQIMKSKSKIHFLETDTNLPEILFITSCTPRECGIATYSEDLIKALENKFNRSFKIEICPVESDNVKHQYSNNIKYLLDTDHEEEFVKLAEKINSNNAIQIVMIQHEFGLFKNNELAFTKFLESISKPIAMVFHTVLPNPDAAFKFKVQQLSYASDYIVVMTHLSSKLLTNDYGIPSNKIEVIPHGTHLVHHLDRDFLKEKYGFSQKKILSTFGLLSSGKNIETSLSALPEIIAQNPDVLFLIIGKTHPTVVKQEGEIYRNNLVEQVNLLGLENHVQFINSFLPLHDLLEYLQLTDIYLFTSKNPNQTVSGTFAYAISCGCSIVSTPIPHVNEVLHGSGLNFDFENAPQLAAAVNKLLADDDLRNNNSLNGLHKMAPTSWENAAIAHAKLFEKMGNKLALLNYSIPEINLSHIKKLTTDFGMIQFSKLNHPDIDSGYTLDDNARALVAMCQYLEVTNDKNAIDYISIYFRFIKFCLQPEGYFLNYVDEDKKFTKQNNATNLADANGRAIWALGYLIYCGDLLPEQMVFEAEAILKMAIKSINNIHSTRAMAFIIKGLYYRSKRSKSNQDIELIKELANRLVQMYRHESDGEWHWFESYLTYANSILSEALLCAWLATDEIVYKEIAKSSFDFLLKLTFNENGIRVISNKTWLHKGASPAQLASNTPEIGGEQPIDVSYTILALSKFYTVFEEEKYKLKMKNAMNWFLGNNHLNQIIYNPCTGGCFDGLEETNVNLNQGAESTVSYLMARLTYENTFENEQSKFQIESNLFEESLLKNG
jgi:glycosyltransferase involved in cell wall biosynthesis